MICLSCYKIITFLSIFKMLLRTPPSLFWNFFLITRNFGIVLHIDHSYGPNFYSKVSANGLPKIIDILTKVPNIHTKLKCSLHLFSHCLQIKHFFTWFVWRTQQNNTILWLLSLINYYIRYMLHLDVYWSK